MSIRTTCPYCGVGCGVLATREPDGSVTIAGDSSHPANYGRLCAKGSALGETLTRDDRLLHPMTGGRRTSWDAALGHVAKRFTNTIAEYGPDSIAFYVSGQLLTEDYYVANKLMKGYIGAANIDTNSRLCMASAVAGHKRAFGSDTVPGVYSDLEKAELVVLVGSNLAWCHPVLYQRLVAAKEASGTRIVVIDPRRTVTAEVADLFLPVTPGSDVALWNGLLDYLARKNLSDRHFIDDHTFGLEPALEVARANGFDGALKATGLAAATLEQFYDWFGTTERTVTVFSQGVNQSTAGTDKVNAIINCHLLTGRIGRPGMGPFSITGQPNAMGGREVGGLANQLAGHMELDNPMHRELVQNFWRAPRLAERAGHKAVDLFRAVGDGRVKALWIMATNPADSMPAADEVSRALAKCPFVVVSEVARATDTAQYAHVLLPAAAWGEKDGTVTNSERRISRQRAFLPPPEDAQPDWWIIAEVAKRMGYSGFDYAGPSAIFREHARLSALANSGTRDFDLGAFKNLSDSAYDALLPTQWPAPARADNASTKRFFADGQFYTPDRRARFIPTPMRPPAARPHSARPLILNTGRTRDQWHTMTRSGKSPRLMAHTAEPYVEIHLSDAARYGISPAALVKVETDQATIIVRALITDRQRAGSVFVPIHWTDQQSAKARVDALIKSAVDPVSGQPELKFTPVSIAPWTAAWYAFAVLARRPVVLDLEYWSLAPAPSGFRLELAGTKEPPNWAAFVAMLFGCDADEPLLETSDAARGHRQFAAFAGEHLVGALYVARGPVEVSRSWAVGALGRSFTIADRSSLLAGRPSADRPDPGPIICSCFSVGSNEILAAAGPQATVVGVGAITRAGTNCGSCRPEIARLLNAEARLATR